MSTAKPGPRPSPSIVLLDPPFFDAYDPAFPDSDGEPMADNQTQYKWMVTIAEGLDALFADRHDVLVACDLLWYVDRTTPTKCVAPNVFVAFGRPKAPRHSYKQWFEGMPPQVVFEIHSPSNTAKRMGEKLEFYDGHGVEEYYYYDPETGRFDGWLRVDGRLAPVDRTDGWRSPRLGVTFEAPPGKEVLVLRGPDGEAFQHVQDVFRERKAARRLARVERRRRKEADRLRLEAELVAREADLRARTESARADAERQRAERLAEKLRELGIDPE